VRLVAIAAALAVGGCATPSTLPADPNARFDPRAFFTGRSHGEGTLHKIIGGDSKIVVDSIGRPDRRGGLVLDQNIRSGAKSPRQRRWIMRPSGPNRYTGTLSEAEGPVDVQVNGPRATIRYRMRGGIDIEQHLALQSDGRTLLNRLNARKFGIRVARLEETIRKLD
jgi:hypothetical protein